MKEIYLAKEESEAAIVSRETMRKWIFKTIILLF